MSKLFSKLGMGEKTARNFITILLIAAGGAIIYGLPYFRYDYYDAYLEVYHLTNTQMGVFGSIFGVFGMISYLFGGYLADRVSIRLLLTVCLVYSVALWGLVVLFPRIFVGMFASDAQLIDFASHALRIYCGAMFIFGIQTSCQMTFVSIGYALCSIIVAVMRKFVLLIPLIYIMPQLLSDKVSAVYAAEPVADSLAVIFTAVMFAVNFKKALRKMEEK